MSDTRTLGLFPTPSQWIDEQLRAQGDNPLKSLAARLVKPGPRRVIIESPYAGDVAANVEYARAAVLDCLARGEAPYASHLFFPGILDDDDPEQRRQGIEAGLAWGEAAEVTVVYVDRGVSKGMEIGIKRAHDQSRPVEYRRLGKGGRAA